MIKIYFVYQLNQHYRDNRFGYLERIFFLKILMYLLLASLKRISKHGMSIIIIVYLTEVL